MAKFTLISVFLTAVVAVQGGVNRPNMPLTGSTASELAASTQAQLSPPSHGAPPPQFSPSNPHGGPSQLSVGAHGSNGVPTGLGSVVPQIYAWGQGQAWPAPTTSAPGWGNPPPTSAPGWGNPPPTSAPGWGWPTTQPPASGWGTTMPPPGWTTPAPGWNNNMGWNNGWNNGQVAEVEMVGEAAAVGEGAAEAVHLSETLVYGSWSNPAYAIIQSGSAGNLGQTSGTAQLSQINDGEVQSAQGQDTINYGDASEYFAGGMTGDDVLNAVEGYSAVVADGSIAQISYTSNNNSGSGWNAPGWTTTAAPGWAPAPPSGWSPSPPPGWSPTPAPGWSPTPPPGWSPTQAPGWSPTVAPGWSANNNLPVEVVLIAESGVAGWGEASAAHYDETIVEGDSNNPAVLSYQAGSSATAAQVAAASQIFSQSPSEGSQTYNSVTNENYVDAVEFTDLQAQGLALGNFNEGYSYVAGSGALVQAAETVNQVGDQGWSSGRK